MENDIKQIKAALVILLMFVGVLGIMWGSGAFNCETRIVPLTTTSTTYVD